MDKGKSNDTSTGGGGRKRRWRNEQKDEESVEQMKGMRTGHETAGRKGGKGTEKIKLVVARWKV